MFGILGSSKKKYPWYWVWRSVWFVVGFIGLALYGIIAYVNQNITLSSFLTCMGGCVLIIVALIAIIIKAEEAKAYIKKVYETSYEIPTIRTMIWFRRESRFAYFFLPRFGTKRFAFRFKFVDEDNATETKTTRFVITLWQLLFFLRSKEMIVCYSPTYDEYIYLKYSNSRPTPEQKHFLKINFPDDVKEQSKEEKKQAKRNAKQWNENTDNKEEYS